MEDFGIILLDYKVKILYIPFHINKKSMIVPLLKIWLDDTVKFITYTKTESEFSIILDEQCILTNFSVEELSIINIDQSTYLVLQIFEDNENGINHVGIVSRLSKIFSDNNIPILYINSYNNNYILVSDIYKPNLTSLFPGYI